MFYNLKMEIENKALLKAYRHSKYLEQKLKTHLDVQTQNRLNYINIDFKPQIVKTKQDVARDYYFLNRELKLDYKSLYDAENKTKNREYDNNRASLIIPVFLKSSFNFAIFSIIPL